MSDRGISESKFSNWSEKPHSSTLSLIDLNFKLNVFNQRWKQEKGKILANKFDP